MKESLKVSARQASLLGGLTVLFLLLFGLSGIICCVAADARGLTREMQRFAPPADTGLPEEIYPELGRHLSDYLTGKKESFQFLLEDKDGEERELFHDYELVHMADCCSWPGCFASVPVCSARRAWWCWGRWILPAGTGSVSAPGAGSGSAVPRHCCW